MTNIGSGGTSIATGGGAVAASGRWAAGDASVRVLLRPPAAPLLLATRPPSTTSSSTTKQLHKQSVRLKSPLVIPVQSATGAVAANKRTLTISTKCCDGAKSGPTLLLPPGASTTASRRRTDGAGGVVLRVLEPGGRASLSHTQSSATTTKSAVSAALVGGRGSGATAARAHAVRVVRPRHSRASLSACINTTTATASASAAASVQRTSLSRTQKTATTKISKAALSGSDNGALARAVSAILNSSGQARPEPGSKSSSVSSEASPLSAITASTASDTVPRQQQGVMSSTVNGSAATRNAAAIAPDCSDRSSSNVTVRPASLSCPGARPPHAAAGSITTSLTADEESQETTDSVVYSYRQIRSSFDGAASSTAERLRSAVELAVVPPLRPLRCGQQLHAAVQMLAADEGVAWDRSGCGRLVAVDNMAKISQIRVNELGLIEAGCRAVPGGQQRAPRVLHSACSMCGAALTRTAGASTHYGKVCRGCRELCVRSGGVKRGRPRTSCTTATSSSTAPAAPLSVTAATVSDSKRARRSSNSNSALNSAARDNTGPPNDEQAVRSGGDSSADNAGKHRQLMFSWRRYMTALRSHLPEADVWSGRRRRRGYSSPCRLTEAGQDKLSVGHWLETLDPRHPHNMCAAQVIDILGELMCVQLDDAENGSHRFWTSVDSSLLFPCGHCHRHWPSHSAGIRATSRCHASINGSDGEFCGWRAFLTAVDGAAAPAGCFSPHTAVVAATASDVSVGHCVEVAVPAAGGCMTPGRVLAVRDGSVLVQSDYEHQTALAEWLPLGDARLRPAGWAHKNGMQVRLNSATDELDTTPFHWQKHLTETRLLPAPAHALTSNNDANSNSNDAYEEDGHTLTSGRRLELLAADDARRVHVAHVVDTWHHGLVHVMVDGGGSEEDGVWLPVDSWRLQAVGWSARHGLPIVVPPVCAPSLVPCPGSPACDVAAASATAGRKMSSAAVKVETHETARSVDALLHGCNKDVGRWDSDTVRQLAVSCGASSRAAAIVDEQKIDGESLLLLTKADLVDRLHIPLGVAVKMSGLIERARAEFSLHISGE